MRFMVLVPATPETEAGRLPTQEELAEMGRFNDELIKAGVMLARDGLQATSKGARVSFEPSGKRTVFDGPFTESKELVAGYRIWDVRSMEEPIEWAKRAPFPPGTTLEIRPVFESEDFEDAAHRTTTKPTKKELRS